MKSKKSAPKKKLAQAMVEFAIVLPILLLLLYGILETGRLLFMYSTIVTATRQAVRYGSATGLGVATTVPRYQDCAGIRKAAQKVDYLNAFDDTDIVIYHDTGPGSTKIAYCGGNPVADPPPASDTGTPPYKPSDLNTDRLIVEVTGKYNMIVKLVPFGDREIKGQSARTILMGVSIAITPPGGSTVNTTTTQLVTSPNPSELNQDVNATVTVTSTGGTPTGSVDIFVDGNLACDNVGVDGTGTATCPITGSLYFNVLGTPSVKAVYTPDTGTYSGSEDTITQTVGPISTTVNIIHAPNTSVQGDAVPIIITVSNTYGGSTTPTGTVDVNICGVLSLPPGSSTVACNPIFNTLGMIEITATYSGDAEHLASTLSVWHEVLTYTPTPSNTPPPTDTLPPPTPTYTPSPTLPAPPTTPTYTPTPAPTDVLGCGNVTRSLLKRQGKTMSMTINNPNPYPITVKDVLVVWNHDFGHKLSGLKLTKAELGDVFWESSSGQTGPTMTITPPITEPVTIPGNGATSTIVFTFDTTYLLWDDPATEEISINLSTPGCQLYGIRQTQHEP